MGLLKELIDDEFKLLFEYVIVGENLFVTTCIMRILEISFINTKRSLFPTQVILVPCWQETWHFPNVSLVNSQSCYMLRRGDSDFA